MFFQLGTGTALADSVTRAGFARVASDCTSTELLYDSGDAAADAVFAGGPVAMAYSRLAMRRAPITSTLSRSIATVSATAFRGSS